MFTVSQRSLHWSTLHCYSRGAIDFLHFITHKYTVVNTVCPRSSDPFYIVSFYRYTYYAEWVTTSWTHSISTITSMSLITSEFWTNRIWRKKSHQSDNLIKLIAQLFCNGLVDSYTIITLCLSLFIMWFFCWLSYFRGRQFFLTFNYQVT